MTAVGLEFRPGLDALGGSGVARTELVTPGMCGPNSLFMGQLGDWTWDAVSAVCDTNVYDAKDPDGNPTYLSFYYFRVKASHRLHPLRITFGDRLQVVSGVFGYGRESVLALHRIRLDDGTPATPIEPHSFYGYQEENCIQVENFNRWITRSRPESNRDLATSSPVGFRHEHLPSLPDEYSPRRAYAQARAQLEFEPAVAVGPVTRRLAVEYPVEASRDLNGVGLLYFASYFSIVDWAVLRLWRSLGRTDREFLHRAVLDHRLCYLGNADSDAVVRVELTLRPDPAEPAHEVVDAVLRDRDGGGVLAVSSQYVCTQTAEEHR